jgi:hypothetical protein
MFLGGWVEVKAVLRIAYSNQKVRCICFLAAKAKTNKPFM